MRRIRLLAGLAPLLWSLSAATEKEQPVGLIMTPGGGKLLRAGNELPLTAKAGDILFAGDSLRSESEALSFLFCPEKSLQSLPPKTEVVLAPAQVRVKAGRLGSKNPVGACLLPQVVRVSVASQQHYGVTMTRTLRPAQPPEATLASRLQALPPDQRQALLQELEPLDKTLAAQAGDPAARMARAALLENYKLTADALEDYKKLAAIWSDAAWVRGKIFELQESLDLAAANQQPAADGKTYALLVGISRYQRLPESNWLQFAHADATAFEKHVKSPRGGGLPDENVILLTDEKATTAAIRTAFETFLKGRAGKNDTVLLFMAAHGTVETEGRRNAYIITYDSDPQDLASTALPMADVQELIREELTHVGRTLLYVDVCRSGNIGAIRSTTVNASVERLGEAEGEVFGLMASRPKELSMEGPEFGGGHGVFSYYLLKALSGAADKNNDKIVDANEVIRYVQEQVSEGTRDRQHPRDFGSIANNAVMSDLSKPGIDLALLPVEADVQGHRLYFAMLGGPAGITVPATQSQRSATLPDVIESFRSAVAAGRLLPNSPGSAFAFLDELRQQLRPELYLMEENRLRVALEDAGQQVLLRYLTGDQTPQTRSDFARGAAHFEAARRLTPESQLLDARHSFCEGRTLLFDRDYQKAMPLLEQAARIDSDGAYSYNALGIAYLEQANYELAVLSFRDAIRRAPYWAYPLHNLALAYTEMGNYRAAIRQYQQAMRLAPHYSYLAYNLGLVHQRLNQKRDAEAAYRRALELSPESAEPYNALGSLKADSGRDVEAERLFRQALDKNPNLLAARHNLALLLARKPDRVPEAIRLWESVLSAAPDYLASHLSLAETLARQGQHQAAAGKYLAVVHRRPDYLAARVAAADQLAKAGRPEEALNQLQETLKLQPQNGAVYEQLGDLEKTRGRLDQARTAYQSALGYAGEGRDRKRIRGKLNALASRDR
jgi:tetratricopeptide (TPR) repeat protein